MSIFHVPVVHLKCSTYPRTETRPGCRPARSGLAAMEPWTGQESDFSPNVDFSRDTSAFSFKVASGRRPEEIAAFSAE
eukprot:1567508-Prymnesium_polylepis.1